MTTSTELVPVDVDARAAEVERQVAEARAKAEAMQISNDAELGAAAILLREFARRKKAADELRKELTKPLRDHLADLKERFDDAAAPYDEADRILREKVKGYQDEQDRIREAEEARLEVERQEREQKAREERERQGQKADEAKTAEAAIASLPEPVLPKAMVPAAAKPEGVSNSKRWDFEVTDLAALPTHLPDGEALIEVRSGPLRRYMYAYIKEHGHPPEMAGVEFKQVDGLAVRG